MTSIVIYIITFWIMQIGAVVIFKFGGTADHRWIPSFIFGNVIGITSTWIWMIILKKMNPNVASGISVGGAFFLSQVALALIFHSRLTTIQIIGIAAIITGMLCLCLGGETRAGA